MTVDEARKEIKNIDYFCKNVCNVCTANDWYCPTECDTLQRARMIDFERIVKSYARNEGDLSKVLRYINQRRITRQRK